MMDSLRSATNHIVTKIILGIIFIAFLLTEVSSYITINDNGYIAKVNGQKIRLEQLEQALQNEYILQQQSIGERFFQISSNMEYMHQLRKQALTRLIDTVLLNQYTDKIKLTVSDNQIKQTILSIPEFCVKGKFDNNKFRSQIKKMGLSPTQYAGLVRNQLLVHQFLQDISSSEFLLPNEKAQLLTLVMQNRTARLATFNVTALASKQIANSDEIYVRYNLNKNQYLLPESFKVSFILINPDRIKPKIIVNKQEIQCWYNQHQNQFTLPIRKRYSIIQTKSESEANYLLKKLKGGADFSFIAKTYSTDIFSAKNGGSIGWVRNDNSLDELKQAHLNKKGQLSNVIKSSLGFLIVRLDDMEPKQIIPLNTVYYKIVTKLKDEKAKNIYYAIKHKLSLAVKNNEDALVLAESNLGIEAQKTNWFNINKLPVEINYDVVRRLLFGNTIIGDDAVFGSKSSIITLDSNRTLVIRVDDHKFEHLQLLEEVRSNIEQEIKIQKASLQARMDAEKILAVLKQDSDKGLNMLHSMGLKFGKTQQFEYSDQKDRLMHTVFSLPIPIQGKSSYGIFTNVNGDITLIALDEITSLLPNNQRRKIFVNQFIQEIVQTNFSALLSSLRATANIRVATSNTDI